MNTKRYVVTLLLLLSALIFTACTSAAEETAVPADEADEHVEAADGDTGGMNMDSNTDMESDHGHVEAPDEFASLTNPFTGNEEAIAAGKVIFETSCATCHGPEGLGDGPASEALDPKPATLADGAMMDTLSDGYLFWRVSKGGAMEPFNSAMPPWEGFTEEQRWQVISFVRTLSDGAEHSD